MKMKRKHLINLILFFVLCAILLTKHFLYDFYKVPQNGMYPTIRDSKIFLCKKKPYESISDIQRGDIVAFKAVWKDGGKYPFIWRVVGLPQDDIVIQDDKVVINGSALERVEIRDDGNLVIYSETNGEAQYNVAYQKDRISKDVTHKEYHVPDTHIFVLGDNRDNALDSRKMGMIHFDSIIAKKVEFN